MPVEANRTVPITQTAGKWLAANVTVLETRFHKGSKWYPPQVFDSTEVI